MEKDSDDPARETGEKRYTSEDLIPLVYDRLRAMAARALSAESPAHTLQPTALVHEAFLKLSEANELPRWADQNHYLAAAAEAMRRILVDHARRRRSLRRSGGGTRAEMPNDLTEDASDENLLFVDEVIDSLKVHDAEVANLVRLHIFVGLTIEEAGAYLSLPSRTAYRRWAFARAWMVRQYQATH